MEQREFVTLVQPVVEHQHQLGQVPNFPDQLTLTFRELLRPLVIQVNAATNKLVQRALL